MLYSGPLFEITVTEEAAATPTIITSGENEGGRRNFEIFFTRKLVG